MNARERIGNVGLVPIAAIEQVADAIPTAKALLAGGVEVMSIPFGAAAPESLFAIAAQCPEMLLGVTAVRTLEQCKTAVAAGAGFVMTPGFQEDVIAWCLQQQVCVIPTCVTSAETMAASAYDLELLGFCPAEGCGGLAKMLDISASFDKIHWILSGDAATLKDYVSSPFIHAVSGTWLCPKAFIAAHSFDEISNLCRAARKAVLGFEVAHIGINTADDASSLAVCEGLNHAFGFEPKLGNSSNFAGDFIEIMKSPYLGRHGHIAIRTNSIPRAIAELQKQGYEMDTTTAKFKNGKLLAIYLKQEFGGFAVHLLQKS